MNLETLYQAKHAASHAHHHSPTAVNAGRMLDAHRAFIRALRDAPRAERAAYHWR